MRSCLSAFRSPVGFPSYSPIWKIVVRSAVMISLVAEREAVAVAPAETATVVVAASSSSWYSATVYEPSTSWGDVKEPSEELVQDW